MSNYIFSTHTGIAGHTIIPNLFIDEYMPSADGNFVKVYLSGLMNALSGQNIEGELMSRKLGLIESDIIRAWEYWESKGLVKIIKSDIEINIKFLEINQSYHNVKNEAGSSLYSPETIHSRMSNSNIKDMFESIEKLLGRTLSQKEISLYFSWLDDYQFSPEVIILMIEYCKSRGKVDFRYTEIVALGWHDSGIRSVEDAQKYISQHEGKYNNYRLVLDFLGLKENELMKPQEEFLDKWFLKWDFTMELVLEACKICSLRINEPNFSYIDGILSNWHKKGFKKLTDIGENDSKNKSKNVKFKAPVNSFNSYTQRSYDVKELENKLLGRSEEADDE